LTRAFPSGV